jgi:UDP-N-acetylmuramoylalanine--D-glutamate ligase
MQIMKKTQSVHQQQRYLVVGLGLTGYSVACYLLSRGYSCSVQDDRQQPPFLAQLRQRHPHVELIHESVDSIGLGLFDCYVVSPGLSIRTEALKKVAAAGIRIIGDIELFAEAIDKPVLAITGSNGKSTVTDLLGKMILADHKVAAVGGNFGVPALELLEQDADLYVLELSSFQLETTRTLKPLAATVLNISEDHMDRYHDLADYQQCKQTIYHHASFHISNMDDDLTRYDENDIQFSVTGSNAKYSLIDTPETMLAVGGEGWIKTSELRLRGRHNWANCLAAMALADVAGISKQAMLSALKSYSGLAHRSQWVAEINGVNWINDSKATNPGAAKAAIDGLQEPIILLAGGQGKGADMALLCETLKQHVKTVLLFGEDADSMQSVWKGYVKSERVDDLQQAVRRAHELAIAGDIVLLSPACASFDQFSGFADRGDQFCNLVRTMA